MTTFLIEYNNKIIGTYQDYESAEIFILSCLQNNLMQNSAKILKFRQNSCYYFEHYIITLPSELKQSIIPNPIIKQYNTPLNIMKPNEICNIKTTKQNEEKTVDYDDPKIKDIAKSKLELQHNINMLKVHKQRLEESKKIYENDMKLFNMFSENIKNDTKFIIPELFVEKYNIMKKLKAENMLSWENFISEYKHENYYGDYFGVNDYDEYFYKPSVEKSDNIEEELDIESASDTETSEN